MTFAYCGFSIVYIIDNKAISLYITINCAVTHVDILCLLTYTFYYNNTLAFKPIINICTCTSKENV